MKKDFEISLQKGVNLSDEGNCDKLRKNTTNDNSQVSEWVIFLQHLAFTGIGSYFPRLISF